MRLTSLDRDAVAQVVRGAHDLDDVLALRGHRDVNLVIESVMATASFAWMVWDGGAPVTVFGAHPASVPGVWAAYLMTLPEFGRIALPLTKFVRKAVIPVLFNELHARRLQADLHEKHVHIHRWVKALGATEEGRMKEYSPGGDYLRFALCRSRWLDKYDKSC